MIPKLGNLALPTKYYCIQMKPLIVNLYGRVLSNRLLLWVNDEQTAFQKGTGTIDLLHIIIALVKINKAMLNVSFFDLSKAFDHVSSKLW